MEQDQHLDNISNTANRLKHIGITIGDILTSQNHDLESLRDNADNTTYVVKTQTNKINHLNQKSTKWFCATFILLLIGIVLVATLL